MMVWAINLFVLSIGLLIVGMIKPKWIIFWLEKPGRMPIIILSAVLFMVGAVMFGEANQAKQESVETQNTETNQQKEDAVPTIATEPKKIEVQQDTILETK